MEHKFEVDAECPDCRGRGLYVGMGERDGAGIVCSRCKGAGHRLLTLTYRDFEGRKVPKDVTRVYACNPGIVTAPSVVPGGVPTQAWLDDEKAPSLPGREMRAHTCPAWWYQTADYAKKPDWKECNESLGGTFSRCPSFANKAACWERWDREHGVKP